MKSTKHFKNTIHAYLEERAGGDPLFERSYTKENKNIDDCITYILNTVQKSGCMGFTDDEVYSMAVHYYDEDSIEVGSPINAQIAVNHVVELTEEEKQQARKKAINQVQMEAYQQMKKPVKRTSSKKKEVVTNQLTLF